MSLSVSGTQITFPDASTQNTAATGFGFKNRIINGAMMIDQRNGGAAVTPTTSADGWPVDRFAVAVSQNSKLTAQQNAGSVTLPVGFSNYLGVTSSSAYSVLSSDYFAIYHRVEGFNFADMQWGTANAKTVTLSFQVYSSLTGTFGGALRNAASNRSYPFTYTVSSANTWTSISLTIAGDTTGTWVGATNGIGLQIWFGLGVGSTASGTPGSWAAANYTSATGAVSVVGTSGATFYITGVQLEKGSTATSFDYRPYGTEFALCQRYYQKIDVCSYAGFSNNTTRLQSAIFYAATMRTSPSINASGTINRVTRFGIEDLLATFTLSSGGNVSANGSVYVWVGSGMTANQCYGLNPTTTVYYLIEAEL